MALNMRCWYMSFVVWIVEYAIFSIIMLTYAIVVKGYEGSLELIQKRKDEMIITVIVMATAQMVIVIVSIVAIILKRIQLFGVIFSWLTVFGTTYIILMILAAVGVIIETPMITRKLMNDSLQDARALKYDARKFWINYQQERHCCGVDNYKDWMEGPEYFSNPSSSALNACCTSKLVKNDTDVFTYHPACEDMTHDRYLYAKPCRRLLFADGAVPRLPYKWFMLGAVFMLAFTSVGMYISYRNGVHIVGDQMVFKPFASDTTLKHIIHEILKT